MHMPTTCTKTKCKKTKTKCKLSAATKIKIRCNSLCSKADYQYSSVISKYYYYYIRLMAFFPGQPG